MDKYLPYIVTIICTLISGFASYLASCRQTKSELNKLIKQHELDIEKQREKFEMEKEKMELEHKYQMQLKQQDMENKLGTDLVTAVAMEYMRTPEGRAQMFSSGKKH